MADPSENILRDRKQLQDWMDHNPTVPVDARNVKLTDIDLSGFSLQKADFGGATLTRASFRGCDLTGANFNAAGLESAHMEEVTLTSARLTNARLDGATLTGGDWRSANCGGISLKEAVARNCDFQGCALGRAHLEDADLTGAKLGKAGLVGTNLNGCNLQGANLDGADLTNTAWREAKINVETSFIATVWDQNHDPPNDGADQLDIGRWRSFFNWATIRFAGSLPLFSGSYLLLTFTLSVATAVNWLNQTEVLQSMTYPVPMPPRIIALLAGSTFLAVGTTVFEFACPARVKEYSRTQWIEELRRPGILYVSDTLQKPAATAFALVLVVLGGLTVGFFFIERVIAALVIAGKAIF